ncbi:MAG: putative Ig domain-containing protein [bacterium]
MRKIMVSLIISVISIVSLFGLCFNLASAIEQREGIIFQDNFDAHPDWSPTEKTNQQATEWWPGHQPTGMPAPPEGYYGYRVGGTKFNDPAPNTFIIDSTNHRGPSGKALTYWSESCRETSWASDGDLYIVLEPNGNGYEELYIRFYVKFQPGWKWNINNKSSPSQKFLRVSHYIGKDADPCSWGQKGIYGGSHYPAFLGTFSKWGYGEYPIALSSSNRYETEYYPPNAIPLHTSVDECYFKDAQGNNKDFWDEGMMGDGKWHCWEFYLKMNSAVGVANGQKKFWLDGVPIPSTEFNDLAWSDKTSVVVGTNGQDYTCIKRRKSSDNDRPVTGQDWQTYWQPSGSTGEGKEWKADTYYGLSSDGLSPENPRSYWNFVAIGGNNANYYAPNEEEAEQWYALDDLVISTKYIGPEYIIPKDAPVNQSPDLSPIGNQSVFAGETLSFTISATDPDGDSLNYSTTNLPIGAKSSSNSFTWTPTFDQVGEYQVTFRVSDEKGGEDSETIVIIVNRQEIIAKSGTYEDLQAAVNAAKTGDTVLIPEGTFEFLGTLKIDHKGINLIGSGIDKTILFRPEGCEYIAKMINVYVGSTPFRISGITLKGHVDQPEALDRGILIRNSQDFRIDHCRIENFGNSGIDVCDWYAEGLEPTASDPRSRGVIDHCEIINCYKPAIDNWGYGVVVYHGDRIEESFQPGSREAIFIEDCLIVGARHATCSSKAGRYVVRYCTIRDTMNNHHALDTHGPPYGVGTQWVEMYENLVEKPNVSKVSIHNTAILFRGGAGVIFNNTFKDYADISSIRFQMESGQMDTGPYPRPGQVNNVWIWNNNLEGNLVEPVVRDGHEEYIQKDRDYFCKIKPGYQPYPYPHPLTQLNGSPVIIAPQIIEGYPYDQAGIKLIPVLDNQPERVPSNTSCYFRVKDDYGLDMDSLTFTITYDGHPDDTRIKKDNSSIRVKDYGNEAKDLLVVCDLTHEKIKADELLDKEITVTLTARNIQGQSSQKTLTFKIETAEEKLTANSPNALPQTETISPEGAQETIQKVMSGEIADALLISDKDEPVKSFFGPEREIPTLSETMGDQMVEGIGSPLNLQPPTVFDKPVTIHIPCLGVTDIPNLSIFYYNGQEWKLACSPTQDGKGKIEPGGDGWIIPGSRVDHNETDSPGIDIQLYHFSGIQAGLIKGEATPVTNPDSPYPPDSNPLKTDTEGESSTESEDGKGYGCFIGIIGR